MLAIVTYVTNNDWSERKLQNMNVSYVCKTIDHKHIQFTYLSGTILPKSLHMEQSYRWCKHAKTTYVTLTYEIFLKYSP